MEDLWDVKRVARYLDVTERTVYGKLQKGEIPAIRVGGRWRFRPEEIEAWLDEQRAGAAARGDAPLDDECCRADGPPDRAHVESLLSDIDDPMERRLAFVGVLSRACRARGWREPVVVGGHAVEFYTAGGYTTVDIDLVAPSDGIGEVLGEWGFDQEGRHWYDESLGLLVEAPGHQLEPEQQDHLLDLEVHGEHVAVLGIEDLVVDRLNAFVHWGSREAREWARVLIEAHRGRIDWDYLRKRATDEDIEAALAEAQPGEGFLPGARE
jgi:excisionase family DNA binding protein